MPRLQPAKISAINWARLLGRKLKNSVMAFKILEDDPALKNSFLKRSAFKQYFELMTMLYQFEKMLFERFMQNATFIVNHTNRSNILQIQICKEETRECTHDHLESLYTLCPSFFTVQYISDMTATIKGKSKQHIFPTNSSIFGTSQAISVMTIDTESHGDVSIEDDDEEAEEQAAVEGSHLGFQCKVNRFTVLTAMIMWMVGKTKHANKQYKKALAFLTAIKEKKAKDITQQDRDCTEACECE